MTGWLWVIFTVVAAAGQTARNTMQRSLTAPLGAAGATHVRFLFALPFGLLLLGGVLLVRRAPLPPIDPAFAVWLTIGAVTQILATLLMLMTMARRSFVVSTAFLKMEPVITALLGFMLLGDRLTATMIAAILIATGGMVMISLKSGTGRTGLRSAAAGLASGALFAGSAVGFRGAILSLPHADHLVAATFTLATGLILQSAILSGWLRLKSPGTLTAMMRAWKPCAQAGLIGATASEFWFLAFALATAASVRTLGMVDVVFAQGVSHLLLRQKTNAREAAGIVILLAGGILLVWAQP